MSLCVACSRAIDGASIADPETGDELHVACLADRLAQDALLALTGAVALCLAPLIVVWAA